MTAAKTVAVRIIAMAADNSELEDNQALMIAGDITFDCGPIRKTDAPSSRTEAMKISNQAAAIPGRNSGSETVRI
jgi:hypothetical protein